MDRGGWQLLHPDPQTRPGPLAGSAVGRVSLRGKSRSVVVLGGKKEYKRQVSPLVFKRTEDLKKYTLTGYRRNYSVRKQ